ncbi:hypothetical protein ACFSSC_04555 [Corynebacterium mendelii]|uniref:Uncharacterized protein n=1 Tax=Corynebacterium mendelii TaxID=2765362 RepID=A0A939DY17_9CORY|nr:hypothetical protein [Corynebacterium mendelii]MBN9643330.1 hypothetical protein [Corynebacterium mendelii]
MDRPKKRKHVFNWKDNVEFTDKRSPLMRVRAWALLAVLAAGTLLLKASRKNTAATTKWVLSTAAVLLLLVAAVLSVGIRSRRIRRRAGGRTAGSHPRGSKHSAVSAAG